MYLYLFARYTTAIPPRTLRQKDRLSLSLDLWASGNEAHKTKTTMHCILVAPVRQHSVVFGTVLNDKVLLTATHVPHRHRPQECAP